MNRGADEVVFKEGDQARELYVLLMGEVEVFKVLKRGAEARLATLSPGHWFGEMSVLDAHPRSASVRALEPCRLLVVTARDLDALYRRDLKSYTLLVLNIARELARRLRLVDELVADFVGNIRTSTSATVKGKLQSPQRVDASTEASTGALASRLASLASGNLRSSVDESASPLFSGAASFASPG